jgi:adenylate cyclase
LSERLEPEEVAKIMNQALTIQENAVKANDGMVDKYIGDAMMAIFNAPMDLDNHEDRAIATAIQIAHDIKAADLGIDVGIGINSGKCVVGNMGSSSRFDYTAIGDAVNLAARLESSTKEVQKDIVIGEQTMKGSSYVLEKLSAIKVKGKEKAVNIFTYPSSA